MKKKPVRHKRKLRPHSDKHATRLTEIAIHEIAYLEGESLSTPVKALKDNRCTVGANSHSPSSPESPVELKTYFSNAHEVNYSAIAHR